MPAIERNDTAAVDESMKRLTTIYTGFSDFIDDRVVQIGKVAGEMEDEHLKEANAGQLEIVLINVGIMLLIGMLLLAAYAFVVRSITTISSTMSKLAGGDLTADIPFHARRDEIGLMSKAVSVFKQQAIKNRENASASEFIISALGQGLEKLSSGNLTYRLTERFPEGMERSAKISTLPRKASLTRSHRSKLAQTA